MKKLVLAVGAALLLAGCGSATTPANRNGGAVAPPRPQGVADPATIPSSAPGDDTCPDPTASLAPPASMPIPGHMPAGSTMAAIKQRGHLIAGVDQNTYLFGYREPNSGDLVGFDTDMVRAVANAIFGDPAKVTFVAITSAERIPYLQQHKVDIVADTMTINCARWKQVDFSSVYFVAGQTVLVDKASSVNSIDQLGGKKVCAAAGSTSITAIAARPSHPIPVAVSDWTDCLVMLQQHQVDAISTDNTILSGLKAQDPDTRFVSADPFTQEPYGLAMNQDQDDLVRFVNGVLNSIRGNGYLASRYHFWLGSDMPTLPDPKYRA
jgi:polar amino acid transport system substrate-binding protein